METSDIAPDDTRVALVTGAGSGIGRATAQAFADAGYRVVVSDVDADPNEETADLIREEGGHSTGRDRGRLATDRRSPTH